VVSVYEPDEPVGMGWSVLAFCCQEANMATVTIRNLSDEVVAALKERARRNSRSMEAEVREMLVRSLRGDESANGMEDDLARRLPPPRRWSVRGDEVMAWIEEVLPSDQIVLRLTHSGPRS
jgi:plasmid stability protein